MPGFIAGSVLLMVGEVLFAAGARFPGGVVGDIALERGDSAFYFPFVWSIVLSIDATIVINILLRLLR